VAPLVGVLGNDELALSIVMTVGVLIALVALLAVGVPASHDADEAVPGDAVAEPA
jgi:DHA1 family bicyclomycin/chloramphenicol resistance-like MFS transporter